MAILDIEGREVEIDDSFLKQSPENQNAIVLEITKSLSMNKEATPKPGIMQQSFGDNMIGRGLDTLHDATTGAGSGVSLGGKDELLAGMAAPFRAGYNALTGNGFDLGAAYDTELANQRGIDKAAQGRSPKGYTTGEIIGGVSAGGIGSPATLAARAPAAALAGVAPATTLGMAGRGAVTGAGMGGAAGFLSGEGTDDRLGKAAVGGAAGAALGGVLGGVTGSVAKRAARRNATTSGEIGELADDLYDAMDNLPAYAPDDANSIVPALKAAAKSEGISKSSFPRIHSIIKDIGKHVKETGSIDPRMLDIYRRRLNGIRKDPSYSAEVGHIVDELDDIAQNRIGGEVGAEARARFRQKIQLGKVENAVKDAYEVAGRSSQNVSQHLKVKIGGLLRADRNAMLKGRPAQFDKEMRDQMQKIVDTGTLEGMMNWLGKAAPDSGLGALGHVLTAISTGGSSAAIQVPIALGSLAAKKAGASATQSNVDALQRIISNDPNPEVSARARSLLNKLLRGGAVATQ
jgi:hypothetical protein